MIGIQTTCDFVRDRRSPEDLEGCMVYLRVHTSTILKLLRITGINISRDGINKRDQKIVKRAAYKDYGYGENGMCPVILLLKHFEISVKTAQHEGERGDVPQRAIDLFRGEN
jgi:hypothetical protein